MTNTPPPSRAVPRLDQAKASVTQQGQGPELPKMPLKTPVATPVVALLEASKPIAFNINFARITGDTKAALLLSQLVYWTRRGADVLDNDGWVFKTREQWEAEIGLSKHEQVTARNILINLGLMEEARTGAPARNCYRLNPAALGAHLAQLVRSEPVQWSLLDIRSDTQHMRTMLGRQFAFYRVLMQVTSTCTSAVYLSKALAIHRRFADRQTQSAGGTTQSSQLPWDTDWFRMAVDSTQEDTGLSPSQQRDAKHKLCQIGLLHEAMMTHPRKQLYLRVDMQMLNKLLVEATQTSECPNQEVKEAGECGGRILFDSGERTPGAHSPQASLKTPPTLPSDCPNREVKEAGEWGERILFDSGEWLGPNHSPQASLKTLLPLRSDDPTVTSKPANNTSNDPPNLAGSQNRTTRMTDSDKLDVRIPQGRWPVLARPKSGFSTPSCPVLTGLHAHASRAGQDYKEDYIKTTTTTQAASKVDDDPPKPDILQSKDAMNGGDPAPYAVDLPAVEVVVVSSSKTVEQGEQGAMVPWIWPEPFTKVEREQGRRILNSLAKTGQLEDAQNILDELAGWMATGGVKSNLSYLRKLVEAHQSTLGGLVYERGPDVQLRRQRLSALAHKTTLHGSSGPSNGLAAVLNARDEGSGAVGAIALSDAAKSGLARAREMLASYKKGSV